MRSKKEENGRPFMGLNPCELLAIVKGNGGHSSAGRALQWHCRGRRFDPAWLHHHHVIA